MGCCFMHDEGEGARGRGVSALLMVVVTITAFISPQRRPRPFFSKHFKPFAWAGLALTGIAVGLNHGVAGESGTRQALIRC